MALTPVPLLGGARRQEGTETLRALSDEASGPKSIPCALSQCLGAFVRASDSALLSSGRNRWPQGQHQRAYSDLSDETRTPQPMFPRLRDPLRWGVPDRGEPPWLTYALRTTSE
jgi:hypothetical protein